MCSHMPVQQTQNKKGQSHLDAQGCTAIQPLSVLATVSHLYATIFSSKASDGGNTQQQVLRAGHILPVGKRAPWQCLLQPPTQLSLSYVAKAKEENGSPDYST